jgi:hypothetical protein
MRKIFVLMCLLIALDNTIFGQKLTDLQTWYGASLKYDLPKGWAISGQYRLRMIDNSSTYRGSYFFAQVDKKLTEHFSLMTNYRLALVNNGTFHRYAFGVEAKQDFGRFKLSLRPMIQYQKQNFTDDNDTPTDTDTYLRTRFTVKYPLSRKWDVYAYAEPFYKLDKKPNIDWWQNSAGLKYEFAKGMKANLYYIWQPDYSHKQFRTNHVVGLDLEFTIK